MKIPRFSKTLFNYTIVFTLVVAIVTITIYVSLSKLEEKLIDEKQDVCETYLNLLYESGSLELDKLGDEGLLSKRDLSSIDIRNLDSRLIRVSEKLMKDIDGLEGGFYLVLQDEFYGYAYPTSPPPIPVYGPPPRSYNIIKEQAQMSAMADTLIIGLHSFNVAVFPLATRAVRYDSEIIGAIWVRIHIQNDLPVIKLKQVVYVIAIFSAVGFVVLMTISLVWAGEIRGIKKELQNVGKNPSFRLKERWGIFTYISQSVNRMLDTIEEEDEKKQLLEKRLIQKEKMASLGRVIAGVAHEVKTPLAIIKTRIQMWQKDLENQSGEQGHISSDSMQMVIDETNRLSSLVSRLLIFSRPIEKNLKETDINNLIEDVLKFLDYDKTESNVRVIRKLNKDLPRIMIDENSMKQVLINILNNSCESMPGGGEIIIITEYDNDGDNLVIEILDNGTGIPEECFNEIFVPFFTLKDSGAGLGLAISDQIVKAHNGEITLNNIISGGVRCIVKLPLKQ